MRLELSIASVLKHPNIVQFYGVSAFFPINEEDDSKFYLGFVFELCDEGNLFSLVHRQKAFREYSFLAKMQIARDIAAGMSYVHEHKIVHRDLSTRNVLLANGGQVKIADFGCARQIVGDSYDSTTISGSPAYMSPEQLQGKVLTLKVDVWALGVVIWELLNEQIPWSDRNCNDRKALAKHVAVTGGRLRKTPSNKLTRDESARVAIEAIMDGAFQGPVDKRLSMAQLHEKLEQMVEAHGEVSVKLEADAQRLESVLTRFYTKHNPSKVKEVPDLARLFQGKEHVLNDRLRTSYKVDLTNFDAVATQSIHSSASSNGVDAASSDNSRSSTAVEDREHAMIDRTTPDSETIAERLLFFYQHLNPGKVKVVPSLLKKHQGDYKALNEELQGKYSMDLKTPQSEIKRLSARGGATGQSAKPMAGPNSLSGASAPPLRPGTSAPPMSAPPDSSINSWAAQKEPLLKFFYLQLNPSKVKDVSRVLVAFRNDEIGLNSSLRKTYGIDLSASQEDILKEKKRREEKENEAEQEAEAEKLVQRRRAAHEKQRKADEEELQQILNKQREEAADARNRNKVDEERNAALLARHKEEVEKEVANRKAVQAATKKKEEEAKTVRAS
jgi:serine/threonine protein kinase